jgi:hypothetical protein
MLTHLYSKIGSSFTSGNRYVVYFIPNRAGHLRYCSLYHIYTTIQNGQGVFPSDLQTFYFYLSEMCSLTSKIREDMAFEK